MAGYVSNVPRLPQVPKLPRAPHVGQLPRVPQGSQVSQVLRLPQESQVPQVSWLPQVSITGAAGPRRCHGSGRRSRGAPQVPRESHETQAPRRDYMGQFFWRV